MAWYFMGATPTSPPVLAVVTLGEGRATVGASANGRARRPSSRSAHAARLWPSAPPVRSRLQIADGSPALSCAWVSVTGIVLGTVGSRRGRDSRGRAFGSLVCMMARKKTKTITEMEIGPLTYNERIRRSTAYYKEQDRMAALEKKQEEASTSQGDEDQTTELPWTNIPARRAPKNRVSYWVDPNDIKRDVPLANGTAAVWHVSDACEARKASVGWSASIDGASRPDRRPQRAEQQRRAAPRPEEATAGAPSGEGVSSRPAAQAGGDAERSIDWESPGMNVMERARQAAEEGWEERLWQSGYGGNTVDYSAMVPEIHKGRVRDAHPKEAVKNHIEALRLGKRTKRRLPKGADGRKIHRPKYFSGSDPVHNGLIDSRDDGKTSPLGRMAVGLSKGRLRLQAISYMSGVRGQNGVFPVAERPEVAFIGASNAGKSSLLNAITRTQELADTGPEAGVTRSMRWYRPTDLPVDIIDMPGFGFANGAEFQNTLVEFIATRKSLRMIYFLVDARSGLRPPDWRFLAHVGAEGPPKVFVMTKCDMLPPGDLAKAATVVLQDLRSVPKASQRLIMLSAREGNGMHDLRMDLCSRAMGWSKRANEVQSLIDARESDGRPQGARARRGRLRPGSAREDRRDGPVPELKKVDLLVSARNLPERM